MTDCKLYRLGKHRALDVTDRLRRRGESVRSLRKHQQGYWYHPGSRSRDADLCCNIAGDS